MGRFLALVVAFFFLAIGGCAGGSGGGKSSSGSEAHGKQLHVVATTTMIADLARQIGGHRVNVKGIMAPGGDPHVYKPVPGDASAIAEADAVLVNGLRLEHWVDDLIANAGAKDKVTVVTAGVPYRASPFDKEVPDPHFWFDVQRWRKAAVNVRQALIKADPQGADTFTRNAGLYDAQLASLDGWVRERVAQVPVGRRKLVTSHDAFAYFGEAYGFTVVPVQGISTDAEASTRDVVRVVELVKGAGVPALFVETSVNPELIEQVANETGTRVGGALYSDSTGPLDQSGGTYIGMVRDNVSLIVEGLK
jgi:ABC-type Zn uptake system ZnuABC Zn-binding protein ZnuA